MSRRYDTIVLGLGAMGSAALYHLAERGQRVLGLERFDVPHTMGSFHGLTRIIRLSLFEHPSYVPLVRRAFELWRALETEAGEPLLHVHGALDVGPPDGEVVAGSLRACHEHDLPHERLDAAQLARRFPGWRPADDHVGVFQPDGGFLVSERCVVAHVSGALARGAEVHARERVTAWHAEDEGVRVITERGDYRADRLVVAGGAWARDLIPGLGGRAQAERQVLGWFLPQHPERFDPERFPVFVLESDEGLFYGFPRHGIPGVKLGRYHHLGEQVDAERLDREPTRDDEDALRACVTRYLPDADGPVSKLATCMFTNTPDGHFVVGRHPSLPRVVVAAGFSGHGFKFSAAIGEALADLAADVAPRVYLDLFEPGRYLPA